MRKLLLAGFMASALLCFSQGGSSTSHVILQITPIFGTASLKKDSVYRLNEGTKLIVTKIKMFISDIALAQNIGKETHSSDQTNGLHLLEFFEGSNGSSCKFEIACGSYSDLRFAISVPRELNHSDPTMAPAPLNIGKGDMYWSWNSGYIFLLIEGQVISEKSQPFHFAIGGDFNAIPLSFGNLFDPRPLIKVEKNRTTEITIDFDVKKILLNDDDTTYDTSNETARIVHGGVNAARLRSNILRAFSFRSSVFSK
jgi:hypothetical protein